MKTPTTNCPNCNSLQRFPPKTRKVADRVEIYIVCLTCKNEWVVADLSAEQNIARTKRIKRNDALSRRSKRNL